MHDATHGSPRLSRRSVAFLVCLTFVLASVHIGDQPPSDAATRSAEPGAPISSRAIEPEDVAAVLAAENPSLAPEELARIARAVVRSSHEYGLDPALVTAVIKVESSARPGVRSPKGAVGLMQVMPHMLRPLELAGNFTTVESNIEAGCWILSRNIRRFGEREGILTYFWGSKIRGSAYFERVRAAQVEVRERLRL